MHPHVGRNDANNERHSLSAFDARCHGQAPGVTTGDTGQKMCFVPDNVEQNVTLMSPKAASGTWPGHAGGPPSC